MNSIRINSRPLFRNPETLGEMHARINHLAGVLSLIDESTYGRPRSPRRFAVTSPNSGGATYTLSTTGIVWYTGEDNVSIQTPHTFRDLMKMVATMAVREVSHEAR